MLTHDGSTLEGGGQLTRVALSLSAITRTPIKIHSIRAGRSSQRSSKSKSHPKQPQGTSNDRSHGSHHKYEPRTHDRNSRNRPATDSVRGGGLKESHLAALNWLARQCYADVEGDTIGSREITFKPSKRENLPLPKAPVVDRIELKSPGSVWLIFQAILPYMVFGPRPQPRPGSKDGDQGGEEVPMYDITLVGGTNVDKSISTEYMLQVFLPMCDMIGLPRIEVEVIRRGWTTGVAEVGEVRVRVYGEPRKMDVLGSSLSLERLSIASTDHGNGQQESISHNSNDDIDTRNTTATSAKAKSTQPRFTLPSFTILLRPNTISSIDITLLTPNPETQSTLFDAITRHLTQQYNQYTQANSPDTHIEPPHLTLHPSSSTSTGHQARIYILLMAYYDKPLDSGQWANKIAAGGTDHLHTGRIPRTTKDEAAMLEAMARSVVTEFMKEFILDSTGSAKSTNTVSSGAEKERTVNEVNSARNTGRCAIDSYLADQLVIFQALARGISNLNLNSNGNNNDDDGNGNFKDRDGDEKTKEGYGRGLANTDTSGSLHAQTVRWVCGEVLGRYGVEFREGGWCRGVGWNSNLIDLNTTGT